MGVVDRWGWRPPGFQVYARYRIRGLGELGLALSGILIFLEMHVKPPAPAMVLDGKPRMAYPALMCEDERESS